MRTLRSRHAASMLVCISLWACSSDPSGTGGSGGAGASGTATSATGTGGNPPSCVDPKTDCPAPAGECVTAACQAGVCATTNVADGQQTTQQAAGDCKRQVCDGAGTTKLVDDDDPADDGNDCTADTCSGGSNVHTPVAGACNAGGATVCADPTTARAGQCVQCNGDADCAPPNVCDPMGTHTCVPPTCSDGATNGAETDTDCGGPTCADCLDTMKCMVAGDCQSAFCDASGHCAPCGDDNDCDAASHCDTSAPNGGTCTPDEPNGSACAGASECTSGFCTDGVCCDASCSGGCEACTATLKGQGVDGACGPIVSGTDPENECSASAPTTCGEAGECNGAGACQLYPPGTQCAPQACAGGVQSSADFCDGAGSCIDGPAMSCGNYKCNAGATACLMSCMLDTDCTATSYCSNGACLAKLTNGAVCPASNACSSGNCIDGVCCNSSCGGTCQACNVAGSIGTCTNIPTGQDPANECPGSCNGVGACSSGFTKWSEGTNQWPDSACNPTNSFGFCDTNSPAAANAWATAVCQQNGFSTGIWTGNKAAGCSGSISMWCQGQIPCAKLFETTCVPSDQTKVEVTCF